MKSMQIVEFGGPIKEVESAIPEPQGAEVRLRVQASSVCHTDLHLWHGGYDLGGGRTLSLKERGVKLPLIMGHETVGVVDALGPDADKSVSVGDSVLVYPWLGCGHCDECKEGRENYCLKPNTIGINRAGGYADYMIVPDNHCLVSLQGLDPVKAAPLACSGLTCYSALSKFGFDNLAKKPLVVFGAGGLGLMSLAVLKAKNGVGAIVLEPNADRRQAALDAGALAAIDPNAPDLAAQVQKYSNGPLMNVLDLVNNGQTSALAFDLLSKGGHLVSVGLFGGSASWPLPILAIKALTIQGSYVGSLVELRELVDLVVKQNLDLIPVKACGLHELPDALRSLEQGKVTGRMVVTP